MLTSVFSRRLVWSGTGSIRVLGCVWLEPGKCVKSVCLFFPKIGSLHRSADGLEGMFLQTSGWNEDINSFVNPCLDIHLQKGSGGFLAADIATIGCFSTTWMCSGDVNGRLFATFSALRECDPGPVSLRVPYFDISSKRLVNTVSALLNQEM